MLDSESFTVVTVMRKTRQAFVPIQQKIGEFFFNRSSH